MPSWAILKRQLVSGMTGETQSARTAPAGGGVRNAQFSRLGGLTPRHALTPLPRGLLSPDVIPSLAGAGSLLNFSAHLLVSPGNCALSSG